jgi:hypothetical protein
MSRNSKKSMGWMFVLILFGVIALFGGVKWAILLIPAATLVWYGSPSVLRSSRN